MSKHEHCNVATRIVTNTYTMNARPSDALWFEFGRWIKEQRDEARLSQAGAAGRAGIDRQQWYRIEAGKSGTKRDTAIAIARALSLPTTEVLIRAGFNALDEDEDNRTYSFDLADDVRVKMLEKPADEEEQKELEEELRLAYELIRARLARKRLITD